MIIGGPIYRAQLSVMTILFLSTVILTGPAWCSQLCYFGAFDNLASGGKTSREILKHKGAIKSTILILVIAMALILRWLQCSCDWLQLLLAVAFGISRDSSNDTVFAKKEEDGSLCNVLPGRHNSKCTSDM